MGTGNTWGWWQEELQFFFNKAFFKTSTKAIRLQNIFIVIIVWRFRVYSEDSWVWGNCFLMSFIVSKCEVIFSVACVFSCENSLWPGFWELLSRTGLCLLLPNTPGIEQVYMNFQLGVFCTSKGLCVWVLNPHEVQAWTCSLPQGYCFFFPREKLVSPWSALFGFF